jgi:TRAP-type C4-dicarboxylate transport system permease small subunit
MMNALKLMAFVLIIAGLLGLMYGSFNYTRETQEVKIGSLELSVKDTETVNIPFWVGVATMVSGLGLLVFASRQS